MSTATIKARFTRHAFDRVTERLSLTHDEVAEILDTGNTLPIAKEQSSSRVHYLFYSTIDEQCFVAVQDERDGTVVTILPPDYVNRYKLSLQTIQEFIGPKQAKPVLPVTTPAAEPAKEVVVVQPGQYAQNYVFKLHFWNEKTRRMRHTLLRFPIEKYPQHVDNMQALVREPEVITELRVTIMTELKPDEYFSFLHVQMGKKGDPQHVEHGHMNLPAHT